MNDRKMEIIQHLMEQLQEEMRPSGDELGERLGRPKLEVVKMEGDLDGEEPMEPDMDDEEMEPASPDQDLKRRLLKLRE